MGGARKTILERIALATAVLNAYSFQFSPLEYFLESLILQLTVQHWNTLFQAIPASLFHNAVPYDSWDI